MGLGAQPRQKNKRVRFDGYTTDGFYDELFLADGSPRPEARALVERIEALSDGELTRRHQAAERALLRMGITFNVYGEEPSSERIFPFDIIPRIVSSADWAVIERGLQQRIRALNHFIDDAYHAQRIVKDGVVPAEVLASSQGFRPQCVGLDPPRGDLVPHHRYRSRAGPRRHHLRARRQPPVPVGGVICARESGRHEVDLSESVRGARGASRRRLSRTLATDAGGGGSETSRAGQGGGAHPGGLQRRLLRALVSGATNGRRARRGTRSGGGGRLAPHADHTGSGPDRRALSADRRRLS